MKDNIHRTMIGGQAVIEGVMMRGPRNTAMAVRRADGTIDLERWENTSVKDRCPVLRIPILRGMVSFVEMLVFGYKSLMKSADIASEDEEDGDGEAAPEPSTDDAEKAEKDTKKKEAAERALEVGSMLLGMVIALLLFSVLPSVLIKLVFTGLDGFLRTLFEGVVRIAIFILYLFAISKMKDIRRVYEYHGAEHKTIYCYEHGCELTPENAAKFTRFHPRCGTSFLLIVLIVSILVFSILRVTWSSVLLRVLIKLALLPLIVGISYEIIKFAGRHDNGFMRFLLAPGLWTQRLTTREPDEGQLETAICALKAVLTDSREDDAW